MNTPSDPHPERSSASGADGIADDEATLTPDQSEPTPGPVSDDEHDDDDDEYEPL